MMWPFALTAMRSWVLEKDPKGKYTFPENADMFVSPISGYNRTLKN
jgi:hypothetical protein